MVTLVYFTASWCQPCKTFGPLLERTMPSYPSIAFEKVDVDANRQRAIENNVLGLPFLLVQRDGESFAGRQGAMSAYQLTEWLDSLK